MGRRKSGSRLMLPRWAAPYSASSRDGRGSGEGLAGCCRRGSKRSWDTKQGMEEDVV